MTLPSGSVSRQDVYPRSDGSFSNLGGGSTASWRHLQRRIYSPSSPSILSLITLKGLPMETLIIVGVVVLIAWALLPKQPPRGGGRSPGRRRRSCTCHRQMLVPLGSLLASARRQFPFVPASRKPMRSSFGAASPAISPAQYGLVFRVRPSIAVVTSPSARNLGRTMPLSIVGSIPASIQKVGGAEAFWIARNMLPSAPPNAIGNMSFPTSS